MADVGDEVAAHRLDPAPFGDVVDDGDRARGVPVDVDRGRRDEQGLAGRTVELEGPPGRVAELSEVSSNFETLLRAVSVLMNDVDRGAITELGRK